VFRRGFVITAVVVKEQGSPSEPGLASAPSEGSYAVVRFAPQATADDITNFLRAYKATVVEGPLKGPLYRIRLSETKLPVRYGRHKPNLSLLPRDDPRGACHWPRAIAREPRLYSVEPI
jgi:hypothetical protein